MFSAQEIYILRDENRLLQIHNSRLKRAHLQQLSKTVVLEEENQKLRDENRLVKDELQRVREELERIKKQRDTYKGMIFKARISSERVVGKRILGGQIGHNGVGRKIPLRVDQNIRVFLKVCPNCQTKLKRSSSFDSHTVEDIPGFDEIKIVVTEYKSERQWCSECKKEVAAKPSRVIPHSRLGLNLIIQILIFKYVCRMSLGVLVETLEQSYRIKISEGGIINLLNRTREYLGEDYSTLLKQIRSSPLKHADETSWRIKGINSWLWAFLTKNEVYYTIEQSRGGGIARKALGVSGRDDVLVRDDYSGYKNLKLNQQSCWAHLLRKSREEAQGPKASKQMQNLHFTLKNLYQELLGIINQPFNQKIRQLAFKEYSLKLLELEDISFRAKDAKRVQVRIKNQGANLITALLHDGVPLTNNAAERIIRPAVVIRKISGGSRSEIGAETFATNFSVIQTLRMRNMALSPTLKELLLKGATGKN